MSQSDVDELFGLVYRYYPKRCSFTSLAYRESFEYSRYLDIVKDLNKRAIMDKKLFSIISKIADGYSIMMREHSDYVNYPSLQYTILLHKNRLFLDDDVDLILSLGGKRLDLELYFSLLGDYYYYYIIETDGGKDTSSWNFSILKDEQLPHEEMMLARKLCSKAISLGFKMLDHNIAHVLVPEVETELINSGEATIFNCLFTETVTRYY